MKILVINPGSTTTKIGVFDNNKSVFLKTIQHNAKELELYEKIADQFEYRKKIIMEEFKLANIDLNNIQIVIGRGGLLKPMGGGVYRVNDAMIRDIKKPMAEHASNLGGYIAKEIADFIGKGVKAYIADPTCVDEMEDVARISGLPQLPRKSMLHTLNQKAVARRYASETGKKYEDLNLIVAHLGGGITVGAHRKGKIIDTNNGLDGDGPFSPERAGSLPAGQLVEMCFSGKYTKTEIKKLITGHGGIMAYLNTSSAIEVEQMIEKGDEYALLIYSAMAYQVSKEIGALSTVLKGAIDAILLTGGVAYDKNFVDMIIDRVKHLGIVRVYPGEDEMRALAMNGLMVLKGEIQPKEYY
jgi:butyrate kinase